MRNDEYPMACAVGCESEWQTYVELNRHDAYGKACLRAAVSAGRLLDEGGELNDVYTQMVSRGVSGSQAGLVAFLVARVHPRGKAFQFWWNEVWYMPDLVDAVKRPLCELREG